MEDIIKLYWFVHVINLPIEIDISMAEAIIKKRREQEVMRVLNYPS